MILIGQYDSPFVRRVGVALTLYDIPFEHRPWSVFGDGDKIRAYNPLMRVPTLVLDNEDVLIESHAILDYLDNLVGPERAMFPIEEPARHRAIKIASLASGLADKAVSLIYELRLHGEKSDIWMERCRNQISGVLEALEADRKRLDAPYWLGASIGHADIFVATALRFLSEAHPGLVDMNAYPALKAHAERLEALPAFKTIYQPFDAPV
ncbi:glutathione S-transferase [Rhodopseudomonas julia]|uniref:Glutathione S-transferase n=1 Tax=Rhodopseudomonas julia TaxID=200617 RepID=A0ABU0C1Q9_9BRAD|nr:glutathione S-transferase family protein [Rhodopseudomonas julia]MDQ0324451.1 glutathione S-transferase [Rhodopseudomonas julia]